MPHFNYDWTSQNIELFNTTLAHLNGAPARGLEIGSFEGRSALWFCENILTHPEARLICIDTFVGSAEHSAACGLVPDANLAVIFNNKLL
jgi:predicted O-methyltransferase YrrM